MLATSLASFDWIGLAFVLAMVGALGLFGAPRSRKFVLSILVVAGAVGPNVPINCPPFWRWLGIC